MTKKKKPTLEKYRDGGQITKKLYDDIQLIPNEDKQRRVLETLHRRIEKRGTLPAR